MYYNYNNYLNNLYNNILYYMRYIVRVAKVNDTKSELAGRLKY